MKINKILFSFFISLLFTFNAQAESGAFRNVKNHQYWSSGQLYINNEKIPRTVTTSVESRSSLIVDLEKKDLNIIYKIMIITPKNTNEVGTTVARQGETVSCSARVDQKTLYTPKCVISDDNSYYYATITVDDNFIEECKKGNTVRIKFDLGMSVYYRYSLRGFTSALNRATSFLITDEDFFKTPNSKGTPAKTDASYFDI